MKWNFLDKFRKKQQEAARAEQAPAKDVRSATESISPEPVAEMPVSAGLKDTGQAHRLLLYPLTTEKSAVQAAGGQYVFAVGSAANKTEIKRAVTKVYSVKVKSVNLLNYPGKGVNYGRYPGRRKNWRKAVVTLAKGQRLELYAKV